MAIDKRRLSVRVIGFGALLLLVVVSYCATRKVFALGIELGMDRKEVVDILGKPTLGMKPNDIASFRFAIWDNIIFSNTIYWQQVFIFTDMQGKVIYIQNTLVIFGREFISCRGTY